MPIKLKDDDDETQCPYYYEAVVELNDILIITGVRTRIFCLTWKFLNDLFVKRKWYLVYGTNNHNRNLFFFLFHLN